MTVIPHFDYPFRFKAGNGPAAQVEQDGEVDVANCVRAIVKTPVGFRIELPEFGARDQVFAEGGPKIAEMLASINAWEPRASYTLTSDFIGQLAYLVTVNYQLRTTDDG